MSVLSEKTVVGISFVYYSADIKSKHINTE